MEADDQRKLPSVCITCACGVNIAVIKYWGKRSVELNLPINGSLSGTLNQRDISTTTTIVASTQFQEDELWLNGQKEDITKSARIQKVFSQLRARAGDLRDPTTNNVIVPANQWSKYKMKVVSKNNFPTGAGLASSASGYCALVYALAKLLGVQGDISAIARMGSGSACRSLYGGWVKWEMGTREDGSDSIAIQVAPETHWPEMQLLVCVVNDKKKETSSTDGMQLSVKTSKLLKDRAENIVPLRMKQMEEAILKKDYQTFADLTMKDSDSFHAVCADTQPPIYYMNDISKQVVKLVNAFNEFNGSLKAAYTFDAGPNAVLYLLKENVPAVLALLTHYFPSTESSFVKTKDGSLVKESESYSISKGLHDKIGMSPQPGALKYILHTTVGEGPKVLPQSAALIEESNIPQPAIYLNPESLKNRL